MTADMEKNDSQNTTKKFAALLGNWQKSDDGSGPFEVAMPISKSKNSIKSENERAIKDYKMNFKTKNFKPKTPTRGMSHHTKPAQLQNVFGTKAEDETSIAKYKPPVFHKSKADKEMIRRTIQHNFFFDDMAENELPAFIEAFEPFEVAKGSDVITQGDRGDFFYIVRKGKVTFRVNNDKVGSAEEGSSFGELALLYSCPRAATVVAESSPTKLFRVGQKTFRSLLQEQTKRKEADKMKLLKSLDFLSEISEHDLKRLGRAMTLLFFGPGDCLVKKGDDGDAFFILYEGTVEVSDISVGSVKFDNVTLEKGAYFGERALATNEPRAANVIATTKGSAFRIDRKTFEKVLGKFSRVIMKSQDRKIMEGIEVLLSSLTPKQFEELSNLVVDKNFKEGSTIFDTMKRTDAALYIVREGSVKLSGKRSEIIKPGAYFGDDLLLLDTRQEAETGKRGPTKTLPEYVATANETCLCGVLSLSDCRTIFDTTKMIDPDHFLLDMVEDTAADSDSDEELEAAAKMAIGIPEERVLARETTQQWLKKSSKDGLRRAIRKKVKLEDLDREHVLGKGQFGEVFFVSTFVDNEYGQQHFALKCQKKSDPARGDSVLVIRREIEVLHQMDHPYIVGLVHHYEDPQHLYILMNLVDGGELFDVIHTENDDGTWNSGLPECDAKFYAMVIADTLDYIHRRQYVYRDLKPENVLIDTDGYPIICDFGFAKLVTDKTYTLCGTPNYLSPEVIMSRGHNASCDHWALGVLIYEMVAGENPFFYDGMPKMELFQCIVREKFYPLPDEVSDDCFDVVDGLLVKDPTQRLGSLAGGGKDILAQKWFSDLDLDDLRQKKFTAPFIPKSKTLETPVDRTSLSVQSLSLGGHLKGSPNASSSVTGNLFGQSSSVNSSSLLDDSDEDD